MTPTPFNPVTPPPPPAPELTNAPADDESFVTDARATLRPAEAVESKLASLLKSSSLPVSRLARTARPGTR
jgi:hypothetical protein